MISVMTRRCPCLQASASRGLRPRYVGNDFHEGLE